ncbi:hypothetical protein H920_18570 [Fukomys damarensis]|uniref:Uncharacterized protein n=1 Tax=Fukomys damarensis TaxID=885580 RepID=A0A091CMH3_FUKDA|nr:hypothetical protein H920_18570 [Fukomys damarensis]
MKAGQEVGRAFQERLALRSFRYSSGESFNISFNPWLPSFTPGDGFHPQYYYFYELTGEYVTERRPWMERWSGEMCHVMPGPGCGAGSSHPGDLCSRGQHLSPPASPRLVLWDQRQILIQSTQVNRIPGLWALCSGSKSPSSDNKHVPSALPNIPAAREMLPFILSPHFHLSEYYRAGNAPIVRMT